MLYLLSDYSNSLFAVNLPSNSSFTNTFLFSSFFYPLYYNIPSQISLTLLIHFSDLLFSSKYLILPWIPSTKLNIYPDPSLTFYLKFFLFSIFFSFLIVTGAGCSILCLSTCATYFCILFTLITGCIQILLDNFNSIWWYNLFHFVRSYISLC